jgi:hypothetical protein
MLFGIVASVAAANVILLALVTWQLALGAAGIAVLFSFMALGSYRQLRSPGVYVVSPERIFGPVFQESGVLLSDVDHVHSRRPSADSGVFRFVMKSGGSTSVPARDLAEPNDFWEAIKKLLPNSFGFEYNGDARLFRSRPERPS